MADQQYLSYDRVALVPKECNVATRKDCDTSVQFGRFKFKLPVCPSNMKSVVNEDLCIELAQNDYFYIMHRFGVDQKAFIKRCQDEIVISSISVGVQESDVETICSLAEACLIPDYVTIDIAHGHNPMVYRMIEIIKKELGSFVIAGNVATKEGAIALADHGADAAKIGISQGCFIAGTKVLTEDGYKNIEKIKPGEKVLTHKGNYKIVKQTLSRKTGEKENLIQINDVFCTENHLFYVISAQDMSKINDKNLHAYAKWVSAGELSEDYYLIKITE